MDRDKRIIDDMKKLGLSSYEAKAYLTLLEEYPLNGYMLSKKSSIPRSRIYEILASIENKGLVFQKVTKDSTEYYPIDPNIMLRKIKLEYKNTFDEIEKYTLEKFNESKDDGEILVIKGREKSIDFIKDLISEATNRVSLSIWNEELKELEDELLKAETRGVNIRGVYFGYNNRFDNIISHRRIERYLSEKKNRYIIVIVDNKYVISGIISRGYDSKVTWSKDYGLIDISDDYICHDVMINNYVKGLEGEERRRVEMELDELRREYYCFSTEDYEKIMFDESSSFNNKEIVKVNKLK